jgi:hypothetical protein
MAVVVLQGLMILPAQRQWPDNRIIPSEIDVQDKAGRFIWIFIRE